MGVLALIAAASLADWLLLIAAAAALLYVAGSWSFGHFRRQGLPFMRRPVPFLGSAAAATLGREPFATFIERVYRAGDGHDLFGVFHFVNPIVLVRDPELIKLVAVKEFDHFTDHQEFFSRRNPLIGKNLFALKGQEWRDMRATLSPAFTSSKMRAMFKLINTCGEQAAAFIRGQIAGSKDGVFEADMKDFFTRFANDVIATTAFGLQVDSLNDPANAFYRNGRELTNVRGLRTIYFMLSLIIPRIMDTLDLTFIPSRLLKYFHGIIQSTIRERERSGIVRPDMLQLLMQAREGKLKAEKEDEHEAEDGSARHKELTEEEVSAQAIIFFFAGFDTVSTLMCFTSVVLALRPDVQQRLQREMDEAQGADGALGYEGVQQLKYLDMVLSEVQRLYSGIVLDRMCVKDFTFPATDRRPAYTVRKGELLWFPQHGLHLDPQHWPDPLAFRPERFGEGSRDSIQPFTFMPFGLGPRVCIGSRFALMETKIILFHILREFNFVPTQKTPKEIKFAKFDFNNNIEGGFWVGMAHRQTAPSQPTVL